MSEFIPPRPPLRQRPEKTKPPFGKGPRKPLKSNPEKRLKRSTERPERMSADAKVQDAMLGVGRCYLADCGIGTCTDGETQRSHIVPQALIREKFKRGAYRFGDKFYPIERDGIPVDDWAEAITLQQILDDGRNLVATCPNHNRDGAPMVEALNATGFPEGFGAFKHEFGFEFNGRFWYREPS